MLSRLDRIIEEVLYYSSIVSDLHEKELCDGLPTSQCYL